MRGWKLVGSIAAIMLGAGLGACSMHSKTGAAAPESLVAPASYPQPAFAGGLAVANDHNTESYDRIVENDFLAVKDSPLSTFSVDVDTASYSNTRRFLRQGELPPKDAVRVEELINYFSYDYPEPVGDKPFAVKTEVSAAPWNEENRLVHIGLQGKKVAHAELPPRNLVFLLDVSGSMSDANKLPLLRRAMKQVVEGMHARDHVSIVVYAGASGLVLPPTSGKNKERITDALNELEAGGSTNGGEGIQLAYQMARKSFVKGGINRVILATDGDFNVGVTNQGDLTRLIEHERKSGVFLTVLGFGMGNLKDSTLEKLADQGNGNYAYIDDMAEARKVLVNEAGSTFMTIAKDVKIQVEFNPKHVAAYRLVGYENRLMATRDFNDDQKDAGEIGAGHTVTALYEIVPVGGRADTGSVDPLKYQAPASVNGEGSGEFLTVKLRYKAPDGDQSSLLSFPVSTAHVTAQTSNAFRFSAAVAEFGMLLRESKHAGTASFGSARQLAMNARGEDPHGYRREFVRLVDRARELKSKSATLAN